MSKFRIYTTLINREGVYTAIWATLQQLVVASSTYFIIAAIRAATANDYQTSIAYALAFVVSLVVVFVPNTLSVIWLQKWRLESLSRFVGLFIQNNAGKTTWAHSRNKSKLESWLTNESSLIFENGSRVLYDLYQLFMSTILNILVIAWAIDPRISGWYLAAGAVLMLANHFCRQQIGQASLGMQNTRRDLANVMLSAWENIFVGNEHNLNHWKARFAQGVKQAKDAAVSYDRTRTVASSLAVSLALLIIALGNGIYLRENQGHIAALTALLVTLPRQLQVIQNIFGFFGLYLSWQGLRSQFTELNSILSLSEKAKDLTTFVRVDEISVANREHERKYADLQTLTKDLLTYKSGRFTLRGRNGSGKSTILSLLAETTGRDSFFLPSHYVDLAFSNDALVSHSDGNRILTVFAELETLKDVKYILLDEWDANLDQNNIQHIDAAIDRLAADWVIIESRHRA